MVSLSSQLLARGEVGDAMPQKSGVREYSAFISYRHLPDDLRVAKENHRKLETYHLDRKTREASGFKSLAPIFRDADELPISSALDDDLVSALRNSSALIVVCSPRTNESAWVAREVDEFLKTQSGVRIEQTEIEPSAPSESAAPEPVVEESEPADDISDDFDDLFDDNPKPKKKKAPARAAAKKPAPQPSAPTVATKVVFEGEFKHNLKTKAMVTKLNKMRTNLEVALRNGRAYFFGTRYSTVTADRAPADMFLAAVPQAMKENSDYEEFASAVRAKGIVFLPESVLRDLFRNRLDYIKLQERARAVKEERSWEKKLNNSVR
jgi:hypothetical protein